MIPRLKLDVSPEDRAELERRSRSQSAKAAVAFRAKIVLLRAEGLSKLETAGKLGTSEPTVQKWTNRYRSMGLAGLDDAKGRGRKPSIDPRVRERIVTGATQPPAGRARHSTRTMAKATGVSQSTVLRTWRSAGIKPHRVRTFKVSRDPDFRAKFWDVIGLYLDPPEKAVVFCCDEKTQCQALERTQPGLPLGIGHIRTKTHDYTRNGTTNLFAALDCATGKVIHTHYRRHTHREWLAFLKKIWHETPNDVAIEIIADNYATHKHPKVLAWIGKHPRVHVHYTPTSSSWLNLVERFFCEITRDCIREGSFSSVAQLEKANDEFVLTRNAESKPFVWHAKGEDILEKLNKARKALGIPELDTTPPPPREKKRNKGKVICESEH